MAGAVVPAKDKADYLKNLVIAAEAFKAEGFDSSQHELKMIAEGSHDHTINGIRDALHSILLFRCSLGLLTALVVMWKLALQFKINRGLNAAQLQQEIKTLKQNPAYISNGPPSPPQPCQFKFYHRFSVHVAPKI